MKEMKSLKNFVRESAIKKELEKWSQSEILAYLNKHITNGAKPSGLIQKKIKLVLDTFGDKLKLKNEKQLKKSDITKVSDNEKLIDNLLDTPKVVSNIWHSKHLIEHIIKKKSNKITNDPNFRKETLENMKDYGLLRNYCPQECKDPANTPPIKNTGIYLWTQGYDVKKFLGAGNFGIAWECISANTKSKIVRVFDVRKDGIEVFEDPQQFYNKFNINEANLTLQRRIEENIQKITSDPNFRKETLENMKDYDLLRNYCPQECKDPANTPPIKNTGIYLWTQGYDVKKFLGAGGFGVVWDCIGKDRKTHKAVKVVNNNEAGIEEIENAKKLYEMFKNDEKAKKYFNLLKAKKDNNSPILKAVLAQGDLWHEINKKQGNPPKTGKTLDSVLRNSEQALKAVKKLHEAGYSHNDIKPENFLKISDWEGKQNKLRSQEIFRKDEAELTKIKEDSNKNNSVKLEGINEFLKIHNVQSKKIEAVLTNQNLPDKEKINKIYEIAQTIIHKRIHKNRIQLADFGAISKLEDPYQTIWTPGYVPEWETSRYMGTGIKAPLECKSKRDVYALGKTFLYFLFREHLDIAPLRIKANRPAYIEKLKEMYPGENNKRLEDFLLVIIKMTRESWKLRLSVDQSLNLVRELRGKN